MPNRHFLRSDIFTFAMVDSFYFLCFGSGRNEYNSFWAGKGGAVRSLLFARKMYHPEDSVFSLTNSKNNGGCHFTKKVQKSPLYLSYILIQERLGILAARCALYITYSIRFEKNDNPRYFYCSLKKTPNLLDDTSSEQTVDS